MVGTKAGGLKAAATNKARHGEGFYAKIGKKGGQNGHTGGFAANHELARKAGQKGGRASKRGSQHDENWKKISHVAIAMYENGSPMTDIAKFVGMPYSTLRQRLREVI